MKKIITVGISILLAIVCYVFPDVRNATWIFMLPVFVLVSGLLFDKLSEIEHRLKDQEDNKRNEKKE